MVAQKGGAIRARCVSAPSYHGEGSANSLVWNRGLLPKRVRGDARREGRVHLLFAGRKISCSYFTVSSHGPLFKKHRIDM